MALQSIKDGWQLLRHPPMYLTASLIVSIGGLLNGLDTGTIGPVTTMPQFTASFGELSASLHGLVVSSILLTATFASLIAGYLSDTLGRTRAISLGAFVFAFGAALEAGASSLAMFIAGRCIVGIGEGLFISTLVVYVCEISPPSKRGPLASTIQLFITAGLMLGYFTAYGTNAIHSSLSWRIPLAIQAGLSTFLAIASHLWLPHSPRWLAHRDRKEEALKVWEKLGVLAAEREKDLLQNPPIGEPELLAARSTSKSGLAARARRNVIESARMFGKDSRKQMLLGVFMMSMQQLSGIDGVLYYAPLLFQQAGIASTKATFLASGVSAILIFVSTIPAFLLADRWGRRTSTIYGGYVVAGCMALIGVLYASDSVHGDHGIGRWVVVVTIYIFALGYCMTWAVGVKLFASEIQPIATRATATSLAQSANCITNFFVAFLTPILLAKSTFGIYFLFGGCSIITVFVCALLMPETRGHSLESITEQFKSHAAAEVLRDNALVKAGRSLASSIGRMLGGSPRVSLHSNGGPEQVVARSRGRDDIALREVHGLAEAR